MADRPEEEFDQADEMAIEVFQGGSIPRELSSGAMEFLWAKWKALNATNCLSLQRLTEESSHPLRANSTYVLSTGDDFVYMYVGDAIQAAAGFNPTGQLLSSLRQPDRARPARRSIARPPRRWRHRSCASRASATARQIWQGLVLPIKLAPGTVLLVCYSELVSHQSEVCEYLFQTSRDAMLDRLANRQRGRATSPTAGSCMMNDAARELLSFRDGIGNLRLKHLPALQGLDLRFRLHPPVAGRQRHAVLGRRPDIDAEIIRFAHVFALAPGRRGRRASRHGSNDAPALAPA